MYREESPWWDLSKFKWLITYLCLVTFHIKKKKKNEGNRPDRTARLTDFSFLTFFLIYKILYYIIWYWLGYNLDVLCKVIITYLFIYEFKNSVLMIFIFLLLYKAFKIWTKEKFHMTLNIITSLNYSYS
jgi:hypothetical protein